MTSERSNSTPTQASNPKTAPATKPGSQANAANPLPAVGDLSKLSEGPASETNLAMHLTKVPSSGVKSPGVKSGVPFAPSQSIVPEAIPAALVAKQAAAAEATTEAPTPATTEPAATDPAAATPAATAPTPTTDPASPPAATSAAAVISEDATAIQTPDPSAGATTETTPETAVPLLEGNHAPQVRFKNEQGKLLLILPSETNDASGSGTLSYAWPEIMTQLRQRLQTESRHWEANTAVHLVVRDRLLNAQQLQEIVEALALAKLQLRRVYTSRRQTAITASTAGYSVEQHVAVTNLNPAPAEAGEAMAEPLVLKATLRSGAEIRHNGTVVVIGDANPGSSIVAEGDVLVWGRLRGTAHAGSKGNTQSKIMALQMEPAQIRIADFVARGPSSTPSQFFPEVAYVTGQGAISIARVSEFKEPVPSSGTTSGATRNPLKKTTGKGN